MKKYGTIFLGLLAIMVIGGCDFATTNRPVSKEDRTFALNLIRDQGYRCQRITKIAEKATIEGWRVRCFAKDFGTDRTSWPYEVTKMPRGWVVTSWKINSELPLRCQKSPDQACSTPG